MSCDYEIQTSLCLGCHVPNSYVLFIFHPLRSPCVAKKKKKKVASRRFTSASHVFDPPYTHSTHPPEHITASKKGSQQRQNVSSILDRELSSLCTNAWELVIFIQHVEENLVLNTKLKSPIFSHCHILTFPAVQN